MNNFFKTDFIYPVFNCLTYYYLHTNEFAINIK